MENQIRVRFAPSPTGYLHVGGLRTALYDYLYARKVGGTFILRIEDTDRNRYVEGAVENLIKSLQEVGLDYDEGPDCGGEYGPYFQSERTELYQKYAQELIDKGAAYPCFCTEDDLNAMREAQKETGHVVGYDGRCRNIPAEEAKARIAAGEPHVIRLKVPQEGEVVFFDVVRQRVVFQWETVDDQVLIKSDGYPTYHLANVVDDHLMGVSHVIRGEEWLPSTPKHIFMYEQFGWKTPKWVHLPLILNPDRSKLSKRQGDVAIEDFLKKGYLSEALLNFIALLGWHASGDRELFSIDELVKEFSFKRISKAGAVFDLEKLNWMNQHYMKTLDLGYITLKARPFFQDAGLPVDDMEKLSRIVEIARERVHTLLQMAQFSTIFYQLPSLDAEKADFAAQVSAQKVFAYWRDALAELDLNDDAAVNQLIKETGKACDVKGKHLYFPIRLALFGDYHGPEVPTLLRILGRQAAIDRFAALIK
jgi:glutamyl-tRNA synthetase